ncbi:MAG: sigma-70 family RNA polymerase sigma factor [Leucobacter sp.]
MSEPSDSVRQLSEHLIENWSLLVAMSRRIAGQVIDPDDLLSEALLSTFARWQRMPGTIQHLNPYIIGAMRNRVKDELKSPRSKVGSLENEDSLLSPPNPAIDRIELVSEVSLMRRAFEQLPEDQRRVLEAMFYRDQSASQLTEELQRSRPAVSMLAARAKNNLKRTMLKLLLEKEASSDACLHAASNLPITISEQPPTSGAAGEHCVECARCRGLWAQFGTFGAASIGAFLVLGNVLVGGIRPDAAAAVALSPEPTVSTQAEPGTGRTSQWKRVSLALTLVGAAAVVALIWALPQQFSTERSHFDVSRVAADSQRVSYQVTFDSEARGWQVESLEIKSAVPAKTVEAPAEWECAVEAGGVICVTPSRIPLSAEFVVTYENGSAPAYALSLHATTPSGSEITGTATDDRERADDE